MKTLDVIHAARTVIINPFFNQWFPGYKNIYPQGAASSPHRERLKLKSMETLQLPKFTEADVDNCWEHWKEYLVDILNDEYPLNTAQEDLRSLIGSRFDRRVGKCKCENSSWNNDAGCFVCDDCNEKI